MDTTAPLPAEQRRPRLDLANVLWFFGAITAAIATIGVLDKIPESHADLWVFLASLGFLVAYALAAALLLRRELWIPGGLMATVSAATMPAVAYAFTQLVDVYPSDPFFDPLGEFSGAVFAIGLATVAAALVAFAATRFAFALVLVVGAALFTVQLLTPAWGSGPDDHAVSGIVSGAAAVVVGLLLDAGGRRRLAFWFYVGGYFAVGASIVYYILNGIGSGGSGGAWLALLLVGAVVLLGAAFLRRSTWAVYGALGVYAALYHYVGTDEWVWYLLLGVSLAIFVAGIAVARRPARAEPPPASAS